MKLKSASGAELDQFGNVVPMARLIFEQREDEKFSAPFFPFGVWRRWRHIVRSHILDARVSELLTPKWMA
jgi:hypothetical protein